jgi:hypothetical protein
MKNQDLRQKLYVSRFLFTQGRFIRKFEAVALVIKHFLTFSLTDQNTGSAKDWTYAVLNVQYSYGVELPPHYNGNYGFLIPDDHIKPTGQEIVGAIKAISTAVHLYEGRRLLNTRRPRHKTHDHGNHQNH